MLTWYSLPPAMVGAISGYLGLYHLWLYYRRRSPVDLSFALTCFGMAGYDAAAFALYNQTDVVHGIFWQRVQFACIIPSGYAFIRFVAAYTEFRIPPWFQRVLLLLPLAAIVAALNPNGIAITSVPSIRHIDTPIGQIVYYEGEIGLVVELVGLGIPLLASFVLWAALAPNPKRAKESRAWPLITAAVVLLVSLSVDILAQQRVLNFVYVGEYSWSAILLLMSWTLSNEVVDADSTRRQLREAQQLISTTHNAISDAVVTTNLEGNIVHMNAAAERMLSVPLGAAMNQPLSNFVELTPPETQTPVADPIRYAVGRPQNPYGALPRMVTIDGNDRRVDVGGAPLVCPGGHVQGAVVVFRDLTVQHHAIESLRHAKKMESMGQLAGGLAHDLNNLLTPIISYVDLLQRQSPVDGRAYLFLSHVQEAAQRAAALTRQLLALSRKQVLDVQVVSLADFVRHAAPILSRLASEDVEFVYDLDDRAGNVSADPGQLEQVLLNLVSNARDAMPRGGTITIRVKQLSDVALSLQISDTGSGIDRTTMERIFEPFYTTKPRGKGTGLGLASVRGIVDQHGGTIYVESEPGKGTTFDIVLPIAVGGAAQDTLKGLPEPELQRGDECILVVEDDAAVRTSIQDALTQLGYTVLTADGLVTALAQVDNARPDLLITDVVMPGADGPRVHEAITARFDVPCLYVTGHADDRLGERGIVTRGTEVLRKPFTMLELAGRVREILDGTRKRHSSGIMKDPRQGKAPRSERQVG